MQVCGTASGGLEHKLHCVCCTSNDVETGWESPMAVLQTPPDTEWIGLSRDALPSGSIDMSMQLSAMPAAKTLAVTEAPAAPAGGVCPGSLKTDAHSPATLQTSQVDASQLPGIPPSQAYQHSFESDTKQRFCRDRRLSGLACNCHV